MPVMVTSPTESESVAVTDSDPKCLRVEEFQVDRGRNRDTEALSVTGLLSGVGMSLLEQSRKYNQFLETMCRKSFYFRQR